jgi:hypothetical protein
LIVVIDFATERLNVRNDVPLVMYADQDIAEPRKNDAENNGEEKERAKTES